MSSCRAFDTAWVYAILSALLKKGSPPYLVEIIEIYLKERTVKLDDHGIRIDNKVKTGCPQGGNPSSTLWNILIDHIVRMTFEFDCCICLCCDLVLIITGSDASVGIANLQRMVD